MWTGANILIKKKLDTHKKTKTKKTTFYGTYIIKQKSYGGGLGVTILGNVTRWCLWYYYGTLWTILVFIICQMFIVQAHWSIPSHMTICNQAYFLPKTILTRQYYSILFSVMVLLLWCHSILLWHHIVLLFDRNVT